VPGKPSVHACGPIEVDLRRREIRVRGVAAPLGDRALAVLEALLASPGELVTKDALMRRVWPGVAVEDNTLEVHVSAVRKALGPERALLQTAYGRGYRLVGAWTAQETVEPDAGGARPPPPQATASNLPLAASELIGRAAAVARTGELLAAHRLVTLSGLGGIGKTRLALEVAHQSRAAFRDGVSLVELAPLSDPGLVPSAVASAIGLRLGGDAAVAEAVAHAIGERETLIVLDNCEHLVGAAAALAEAILRACPRARILATSREDLRAEGERVFRVPPLDVPAAHLSDPGEILVHGAVALFVERMRAFGVGAWPREEELPIVAAICRRLDGVPLAIEFAAARAGALGLAQILSRLDDRFGLLTGGRRTALPRQRTLRATLDWSYRLLPDEERQLLRCLAVFAGGFTLEAAAAVARAPAGSAADVAVGVANLVAKSLVARDEAAAGGRWRLLETVRAYALEALAEAGEHRAVSERHARHFRDLVAPLPDQQPTPEGLAVHGREIDNVRAALDWAFSEQGDAVVGIELTAAYVPVWLQLFLVAECGVRVGRALGALGAGPPIAPPARARLLTTLAFALLNGAGAFEQMQSALAEALEIAEGLGDAELHLRVLWATWSLRLNAGDYARAQPAAERFLAVARATGDPAHLLIGHRLLGSALHFAGAQAEARDHLERSLGGPRAPAGRPRPMWFLLDQRIVAHAMLARVRLLQGAVAEARRHARASLEEAQAADHRLSVSYALRNALCPIEIAVGDLDAAAGFVARLRDLATGFGQGFWMGWVACLEGQLRVRRGEMSDGVELLRAGLTARTAAGWLMRNPEFMGALAEGLAATGRRAEALRTLREALALCVRGNQMWCAAELQRIRGEILLGAGRRDAGEACFARALDLARRQQAPFWELRAALSAARARRASGDPPGARAVLEPVLLRQEDGGDVSTVRVATALLSEL